MHKIIFLVVVLAGLLAQTVPQTRAMNLCDGQPEIRHYALVRRGRRPIAKKDQLTYPRRPGEYTTSAVCKECADANISFISPISVDNHWVLWHDGKIPAEWSEPETIPLPNYQGPPRRYPLGHNARSWKSMNNINKRLPIAAALVRAERKRRKLFIGHLGPPAIQEAAEVEAKPRSDEPKQADTAGLSPSEAVKAHHQTITRRSRLKMVALRAGNAGATSTQRTAPPGTQQLDVSQSPVNFAGSSVSGPPKATWKAEYRKNNARRAAKGLVTDLPSWNCHWKTTYGGPITRNRSCKYRLKANNT
jgi:hypothetical protein